MHFESDLFQLRPFQPGDESALAKHANNRKIWRNLRDGFPSPYHVKDAEGFIKKTQDFDPVQHLAIIVDGEVAGGIGVHPQHDVHSHVGEVGYWLSEQHWGQGIGTLALKQLTVHAFETLNLRKLVANVFSSNPASMRMAEKAGFELEGILKGEVIKEGVLLDIHRYVCFKLP